MEDDNPQELDNEEDVVVQQIQKAETTARVVEDVEDDDSQEPGKKEKKNVEHQMQVEETTAQEVEGDVEDDDPQEVGKEEDSVGHQMQEAGKTAKAVEEDVEDDDPQELSGSPGVRAQRSADKDSDDATRYRESATIADQATSETACFGDGLHVEPGMVYGGVDLSTRVENKIDRVESRSEPMKPLKRVWNDADWKIAGETKS